MQKFTMNAQNNFISLADYCRKLGISHGRGRQIIGRIPGAQKIGGAWIVPADAADPRKPIGKPKKVDNIIDVTKESAARIIAEASDFIKIKKPTQNPLARKAGVEVRKGFKPPPYGPGEEPISLAQERIKK